MLTIFAVSDATGQTVQRIVQAALVQFEAAPIRWELREHVTTPEQVREVVRQAAAGGGVVFHTLVSTALRRLMLTESRQHSVEALDLMGPVLDRLTAKLKLPPKEEPGLLRQLARVKTRQIEAVEFAFRHDDGRFVEELDRAEVVVVGISRSMKTPITLYLAYREWFAANVPLVPELPLPPELLALPPGRVFCLFMDPARLRELRLARSASEAIPPHPYAAPEQIRKELLFAQHACSRHRWQRIDVTGRSVEEIVREIVALLPDREPLPADAD